MALAASVLSRPAPKLRAKNKAALKEKAGKSAGLKRGPDENLARERIAKRAMQKDCAKTASTVEGNFRKAGGYGTPTVSVWAVPPGGIENSPAYLKVKSRCGGVMPPPGERVGAPLKGGYPMDQYPPNVLVDGQRAFWIPDDWAQVIKNTGPGGSYIGWFSPQGKFFYYRKRAYPTVAVELYLGRRLTCRDGFKTILKYVRSYVKPDADKRFLSGCLTPAERGEVLPPSGFHFAVVSARRAAADDTQEDIMLVEAQFSLVGVKPTWYVDADSVEDYRSLGLDAVVGGKLTPSRNMALDHAAKNGLVCVQVSDDISRWSYYDISKQNIGGDIKKANHFVKGAPVHIVSPLAMAQFMLAKMRRSPLKPRLAGIFPTSNASMAMGSEEFGHKNFIIGDFFVAEKSHVRFDESMTLKEDYDYSCAHIAAHGAVLRCNRILLTLKHSTNAGGAVSNRDESGSKEQANIDILQRKWPGVFKLNIKRKHEVLMRWKDSGASSGEKKTTPSRPSAAGGVATPKLSEQTAVANGAGVGGRAPSRAVLRRVSIKGRPPGASAQDIDLRAVVRRKPDGGKSAVPYIARRLRRLNGRTVEQCLRLKYLGRDGVQVQYTVADLRYDLKRGRITLSAEQSA